MPRKGSKKKKEARKTSEPSTSEASTQSVDDDTQQLLPSRAGASSDGRKSRADENTKKGSRWGFQRKGQPCQSLEVTSTGSSPQSGRLADPEHVESPSKKPQLSPLRNFLERISPNRSSATERVEKQKRECPAPKNPSVDVNAGFGGARPKVFSQKKDGTQSSSSSDPSVAEYFANATESEQSSGRSHLLDPNKGAEVGAASPKKSPILSRIRESWRQRRQGNRSSDTDGSFEDQSSEESKGPGQKEHTTGLKGKSRPHQTMSEASSSSGTSTSKDNSASHKWRRRLNSKSGSKGGSSSDNKSSTESKSDTGSSSIRIDFKALAEMLKLPARVESIAQQAGGEIQDDSIPIEQLDAERSGRILRFRSSSLPVESEPKLPRDQSPKPFDLSDMNIQVRQIDWEWLEERRRRDRNERDADERRNVAVDRNQQVVANPNNPDENERVLLRRVEGVRRAPALARLKSSSPVRVRPCNCGADKGRSITGHQIHCVHIFDLKRRRKRKQCRHPSSH